MQAVGNDMAVGCLWVLAGFLRGSSVIKGGGVGVSELLGSQFGG